MQDGWSSEFWRGIYRTRKCVMKIRKTCLAEKGGKEEERGKEFQVEIVPNQTLQKELK